AVDRVEFAADIHRVRCRAGQQRADLVVERGHESGVQNTGGLVEGEDVIAGQDRVVIGGVGDLGEGTTDDDLAADLRDGVDLAVLDVGCTALGYRRYQLVLGETGLGRRRECHHHRRGREQGRGGGKQTA